MVTINVKEVKDDRVLAEVYGLASDTKPIIYGENKFYNGSVYIEMDTQKLSFYDMENDTWLVDENPSSGSSDENEE